MTIILSVGKAVETIKVDHYMSATGGVVMLLSALLIDYLGIGPDFVKHRVAAMIGLPCVRDGWMGSPLEKWTVGYAGKGIAWCLKHSGSTYWAGAIPNTILGFAIAVVWIYFIGCMLPERLSGRLGAFARLSFGKRASAKPAVAAPAPAKHRLTLKVWILVALIGGFANLPQGSFGHLLRGSIDIFGSVICTIPKHLFGA